MKSLVHKNQRFFKEQDETNVEIYLFTNQIYKNILGFPKSYVIFKMGIMANAYLDIR